MIIVNNVLMIRSTMYNDSANESIRRGDQHVSQSRVTILFRRRESFRFYNMATNIIRHAKRNVVVSLKILNLDQLRGRRVTNPRSLFQNRVVHKENR